MSSDQRRFRKWIMRLCKVFKRLVFAQEYLMRVEFLDDIPAEKTSTTIWAQVNVDTVYLYADIDINEGQLKRKWEAGEWQYVTRQVLHEFCHILTSPLADVAFRRATEDIRNEIRDTTERQTQRIAYALMNALEEGVWMPKLSEQPLHYRREAEE